MRVRSRPARCGRRRPRPPELPSRREWGVRVEDGAVGRHLDELGRCQAAEFIRETSAKAATRRSCSHSRLRRWFACWVPVLRSCSSLCLRSLLNSPIQAFDFHSRASLQKLKTRQVLMGKLHRDRSFSHSGSRSLHRTMAHIAGHNMPGTLDSRRKDHAVPSTAWRTCLAPSFPAWSDRSGKHKSFFVPQHEVRSHSVPGRAPMNTNSELASRRASPLGPRMQMACKCSSPSVDRTCVFGSTTIFDVRAISSIKYFDILASRRRRGPASLRCRRILRSAGPPVALLRPRQYRRFHPCRRSFDERRP